MNRWPVLGLLLLPLSAVFMCWVVACVLAMKYRRMAFNAQLQDENNALRAALKKANDQAEHFEREWYLRGDQVEALAAERDALLRYAHQTAAQHA